MRELLEAGLEELGLSAESVPLLLRYGSLLAEKNADIPKTCILSEWTMDNVGRRKKKSIYLSIVYERELPPVFYRNYSIGNFLD